MVVENHGDRPICTVRTISPRLTRRRSSTVKGVAAIARNIPAGTAVSLEPGQKREVELVAFAGHRAVFGFRGECYGPSGGKR
ncbi:urease subunit beta [Klebsiella pneumoniae]|nr:urease subunit beta [Klebsiella pneumoniae]